MNPTSSIVLKNIQEWLVSATTEKYESMNMLILKKTDDAKKVLFNIEIVIHRPNCLNIKAGGVTLLVGKSLGREVLQYKDNGREISVKKETDAPTIRLIHNLVKAPDFHFWWTGPDYTCELSLSGLEDIHGDIKKAIALHKIRIKKETVVAPADCEVKQIIPLNSLEDLSSKGSVEAD
jgi:hypothetical protein